MSTVTMPAPQQLRPSLEEIDDMVTVFEQLRDQAEIADELYENAKLRLLDLVLKWGDVPAKAEQSRRLIGKLTIATATTGNTVEVKDVLFALRMKTRKEPQNCGQKGYKTRRYEKQNTDDKREYSQIASAKFPFIACSHSILLYWKRIGHFDMRFLG
jgi:hypothetical protein